MIFSVLLLAVTASAPVPFADSPALSVQIALDRRGYSVNTIDGVWGRKTASALEWYCAAAGRPIPATPNAAAALFANDTHRLCTNVVTEAEVASLVRIPEKPADKAKLARMGYESIAEMYAERGHLSMRALERLNPSVDFKNITVGTRIVVPDVSSIDKELEAGERPERGKRPTAALVKVSLSACEISAYDAAGNPLAVFPCSIARNKAKRPPHCTMKIVTRIARPNYTYTPDHVPAGQKASRHILAEGPNNPVGVAWLGLSLPTYGIHGTPTPATIGGAESHGCFRLANWNAARLFALCREGTMVSIEE